MWTTPRSITVPALAVLAFAGCELTEVTVAEPEPIVVAEAYLRAGAVQQRVFLHRTTVGDTVGGPVIGATVEITDEDGRTLRLRETDIEACLDDLPPDDAAAGMGTCYASLLSFSNVNYDITPGERYTLRVELPDGDVLEGVTRVPGPFDLIRPATTSCTLPPNTTVGLQWTSAEGASLYVAELRVHGLRDALAELGIEFDQDTLRIIGLAASRTDTTIVLPTEFGVFDRFDLPRDVSLALGGGLPAGTAGEVSVAAVDRNYVNWVRGGVFHPSGSVRISSIRGAGEGVLASLVPHRFEFTVGDPVEGPLCGG